MVILDIRLRRGALPQLGDETQALVVLQPIKRLSPMTVLYRLLGFASNPDEGPRLQKMRMSIVTSPTPPGTLSLRRADRDEAEDLDPVGHAAGMDGHVIVGHGVLNHLVLISGVV